MWTRKQTSIRIGTNLTECFGKRNSSILELEAGTASPLLLLVQRLRAASIHSHERQVTIAPSTDFQLHHQHCPLHHTRSLLSSTAYARCASSLITFMLIRSCAEFNLVLRCCHCKLNQDRKHRLNIAASTYNLSPPTRHLVIGRNEHTAFVTRANYQS